MYVELTKGMVIVISGITGAVCSIIFFIVFLKVFAIRRKVLIKEIENEYE